MSGWGNAWDDIFSGGQGQGYSDWGNQLQNGMNSLNQGYGSAMGGMNPWLQAGQNELGTYQHGVNAMQDPNFMNNMMQQYQQSPFATFQEKQGQQAMNNQAAASGQLGSSPAMKGMDQYSQQVASGDMNQYLQNRLGVYNNFLNGANNISGMGQQAANTMGNWGMQHGQDMASMFNQYGKTQMGGDMARGGGIDNFLGMMSPLFSSMGKPGSTSSLDSNGMPIPFTGNDGVGGQGGGFDMSKLMSMLGPMLSML